MLSRKHLPSSARSTTRLVAWAWASTAGLLLAAPPSIEIQPTTLNLEGNFARAQLLARDVSETPQLAADRTREVAWTSSNDAVVKVDDQGRLLAVSDGAAVITARLSNDQRAQAKVNVTGVLASPAIEYSRDVLPVLSKAGCNAGACHASQYGKGGFKLSVFAFEPPEDYEAIVRDRAGRRVNMLQPEASLLLLKPTLEVPHGGNKRFDRDSMAYQTLHAWLSVGAPGPGKEDAEVTKIEVTPKRRVGEQGFTQQLRVTATYSDGRTADVTELCQYDSMDEGVAAVHESGYIKALGRGQAPIMVRFRGQAEITMAVVPFTDSVKLAGWQNNNFVDELAADKFRELGLEPSGLCDDATFLRRAYLDAIGSVPTVEQTKAFLESKDPNKRTRLVDQLLGLTGDPAQDVHGNAWSAYWALKWSDLIRSSSDNLGDQGMWALYNWIRGSIRTNKPMDAFVRELITAQGSVYMNGPANYYKIARRPDDLAEHTAQVFMGIRLQCAKCHHHPFEKYGQEDYYGLAAFFARVSTKNSQEFGLFGREVVVMVRDTGEVRHPKTNKNLTPTPLDGEPIDDELDRRRPLAAWLTSPENKFFAYNIVNRYVSYLLGTGLVEPVDDLRATNPPSNPELMEALADHLVKYKYDVKQLVRVIMTSRLYQLDSQPSQANQADRRFYSHYYVKRIAAEPLLDAIDRTTSTQTKFQNLPLGTRAIELPDAKYPDYFLSTFGKPQRVITCECERVVDPNLAQTLHVINGDRVSQRVADGKGRVAKLVAEKKPHPEIVTELYLAALARKPSPEELAASDKLLAESPNAKVFYEDLLWALINSKDFLFVH